MCRQWWWTVTRLLRIPNLLLFIESRRNLFPSESPIQRPLCAVFKEANGRSVKVTTRLHPLSAWKANCCNAWRYNDIPPYVFSAWGFVKHNYVKHSYTLVFLPLAFAGTITVPLWGRKKNVNESLLSCYSHILTFPLCSIYRQYNKLRCIFLAAFFIKACAMRHCWVSNCFVAAEFPLNSLLIFLKCHSVPCCSYTSHLLVLSFKRPPQLFLAQSYSIPNLKKKNQFSHIKLIRVADRKSLGPSCGSISLRFFVYFINFFLK